MIRSRSTTRCARPSTRRAAASILLLTAGPAVLRLALPAAGAPAGSAAISARVAYSWRRSGRPYTHANASGLASKPPVRAARLGQNLDIRILNADRERIEAAFARLRNGVTGYHYPFHDAASSSQQQLPVRSSLATIAGPAVS